VIAGIGLLSFSRYHLADLAEGGKGAPLSTFLDEMTAAAGAGLLFFPVRWLVRAFPLVAGRLWRRAALYLGALLAFSIAHTSMNWLLRELAYPLAGLGDYDYGRMPVRFAMELPYDVLVFVIMAAVVAVADRLRAARERELRTARLEGSLARAELRSLRFQLQPHFLFNALNTISSTMYEDPAAADEMIDRLAELLRASLRTARVEEVPLAEELQGLDAYLGLMKARFGERLEVVLEIDPEARDALVPPMLLQPLVENAVRHGGAETRGRGRIGIAASRRAGDLVLTVEDDGPGAPSWPSRPAGLPAAAPGRERGVGLSATAERLQILYGAGHRLEAGNAPEGGFRVAIRLPFREAGTTAA
jgi:two-component sensor histidine kinase